MADFYAGYGRPRDVEGGLRARSKRGAIGESWWSSRFLDVLARSLDGSGRLQRGKQYARRGQVINLAVASGSVTATVQGSEARPYRVRLDLAVFSADEWSKVEAALAQRALYSATLLAGEMPDDIEDVFAEHGLSVFPQGGRELAMRCSCPDGAVPCKHLAAVCYLLAESFDDDPFAFLAWRGRSRDELLGNLRALREPSSVDEPDVVGGSDVAPLAEQLDTFHSWQAELPPGVHHPATRSDAVLDEVPPLDITVRGTSLPELLRPAYRRDTEA